jgi:hypothetical protein
MTLLMKIRAIAVVEAVGSGGKAIIRFLKAYRDSVQ